jgi:predicted  nucleic acid-binding Zn-ribbon protein
VEAVSDDIDWIARAGARAKGKRPEYFNDFATDRLMSMVMALVGEVSVLRQRQDTVERLLAAKGVLTRAEIERYTPDPTAAYERGVEAKAYIARVMRGVAQALEAMEADDKPVEEVSRELKEM